MPRFSYVGPLDGVDIPLLRLTEVHPGDEFDVTDEQAELLAAQPSNYGPIDKAAKAIAKRVADDYAAFLAPPDPEVAEEVPAKPDTAQEA